MDIKEKITGLPNSCGVYMMKDEAGAVLYVGKAKDLKRRVSSYFHPRGHLSARIGVLISKVRDIEYPPTSTSAEALIYENSLIKQHNPRYNVALRDDKSYPMLKLTTNEPFPRLMITRGKKNDGAVYYGPYASASLLKEALALMRRIFPLRTCGRLGKDLCLSFHIKQCLGPCVDKVSGSEYKSLVAEVKLFLEGRQDELIERISKKMAEAAARKDFEKAAELRSRIEALASTRKERVLYSPKGEVEELGALIGLEGSVDVIEAFDVSNIMGTLAVGSMVSFYKGRPKRGLYKRFRIKTVQSIDDYGMMREVVRRRYSRIMAEAGRHPDLILVDGGRGHLEAAQGELVKLNLKIPVIAIAKELENIYIKGRGPLVLPRDSKALHLLQRIRDEAHRFAVQYHKLLARKGITRSELDEIRGIGPKRKRALLSTFGSVENIKKVSKEDLLKTRGMNEGSAEAIISYFAKQ